MQNDTSRDQQESWHKTWIEFEQKNITEKEILFYQIVFAYGKGVFMYVFASESVGLNTARACATYYVFALLYYEIRLLVLFYGTKDDGVYEASWFVLNFLWTLNISSVRMFVFASDLMHLNYS